jgi:hypothetical protein
MDTNDLIITMTPETLHDGSAVINFDAIDPEYDNQVVAQAGYVIARQDNEDKCFYVTVFDVNGDVLSETIVPMQFDGMEI